MKYKWLLSLVCLLGFSVMAAQPVKPTDKAHFKTELKARIKKMTSFEAQFEQQVTDADGKVIMSGTGLVHLTHPSLIRWHAMSPDENLMVADGSTLWIYNVELEMVTASLAKDAIDSTPFALLASNDDRLWQAYQVSKQAAAYVITPHEQQGQVKRLTLYFEAEHFSRLIIEDMSGQQSEFKFIHIKSNQRIDPKKFSFSVPKGVELEDLRP